MKRLETGDVMCFLMSFLYETETSVHHACHVSQSLSGRVYTYPETKWGSVHIPRDWLRVSLWQSVHTLGDWLMQSPCRSQRQLIDCYPEVVCFPTLHTKTVIRLGRKTSTYYAWIVPSIASSNFLPCMFLFNDMFKKPWVFFNLLILWVKWVVLQVKWVVLQVNEWSSR